MKIKRILLLFVTLFFTSCAKSIATTILENDEWIVVSTFARGWFWDIYGVNASNPQDVVSDMAYIGAHPDWSPDGQWVVYSTSHKASQEESEIYIAKNDGTNSIKVAGGDSPVWSPNGNQLAYTFREEIYLLDITCLVSDNDKSCDPQASVVTAGQNPSWSPDGQRVTFELKDSIYVVNIDGSEIHEVSTTKSGECSEPDWSLVDDKILFRCWGDNWGFYTVSSDGTDMTKIENGDIGGLSPKWSPSGKKIAFIHYLDINSVHGAHSAVYIMNDDGSDVTRLTLADSGTIFGFSWMPPYTKPETCTAFCQ